MHEKYLKLGIVIIVLHISIPGTTVGPTTAARRKIDFKRKDKEE